MVRDFPAKIFPAVYSLALREGGREGGREGEKAVRRRRKKKRKRRKIR